MHYTESDHKKSEIDSLSSLPITNPNKTGTFKALIHRYHLGIYDSNGRKSKAITAMNTKSAHSC